MRKLPRLENHWKIINRIQLGVIQARNHLCSNQVEWKDLPTHRALNSLQKVLTSVVGPNNPYIKGCSAPVQQSLKVSFERIKQAPKNSPTLPTEVTIWCKCLTIKLSNHRNQVFLLNSPGQALTMGRKGKNPYN